MVNEWRERIEDFDDPMITVIDSDNQALMIRVGPVWVEGKRLDTAGQSFVDIADGLYAQYVKEPKADG